MGYELHITRAPLWIDSAEHPIAREEWEAFAGSHPQIRPMGTIDFADLGPEPAFGHTCVDGANVSMWWYHGRIDIAGAFSKHTPNTLVPIAEALDARLVGDDDEEYEAARHASFLDRFRRR